MHYHRIAAVTGANKGIGYAIVRNLALRYSRLPSCNGPILIYLTARNEGRGEISLKQLYDDQQLHDARVLCKDGGLADIEYRQLDISEPDSVTAFASFLRDRHPSGIDILVNNASIAIDGFNGNVVQETLRANYYGTLDVTLKLLPHMRTAGRVVNVASMTGKLNKYPQSITKKFKSATSISTVTDLMENFQNAVDSGSHSEDGWPSSAYAVSKTGVIALTRVIGKNVHRYGAKNGVLVNSCCPGYVSTDMTKHRGRKTPDQGSLTPVRLALEDLGDISGEFWEREELSSW